ncbi:hypothetical protein [Aureibacillus halotolerans]|uniref:Peptidyl-prolyl cis-trans isomerase n=1 Tax=Aureibacillus halotolerans TaxID=1508390 RepID=A0A4V3D630_9BACI|nr:hypothetical protein [Aureibacillus halotolerans]TDQ42277.1 hypothetical protein EV213_102308 [Aureibacillus halotolerans]
MNPEIVLIRGNVKFPITLDPSVWIFDKAKIDLDEFFAIGEAAITKSDARSDQRMTKKERDEVLEKSFAMAIAPYIERSEPDTEAKSIRIHHSEHVTDVPFEKGISMVAAFSNHGKPLRDDGPVHLYFADRTNQQDPFRNVTTIEVI